MASPAQTEASKGGRPPTVGREERKALELWTEMVGICLLPFCGDGELIGELDVSHEDDDDSEVEDDQDEVAEGRAGAVMGSWRVLQRARGADPQECPFNVQPGGEQEDLPLRLVEAVASVVKVKRFRTRTTRVAPARIFRDSPSCSRATIPYTCAGALL